MVTSIFDHSKCKSSNLVLYIEIISILLQSSTTDVLTQHKDKAIMRREIVPKKMETVD